MIAKKLDLRYQPDKRVMSKIERERTADCVVAGYRVHKSGSDAIGSVLLGLYDDRDMLASVRVIGAFRWPPELLGSPRARFDAAPVELGRREGGEAS